MGRGLDAPAQPDGDTFLALGYGPNKGQANHARFDLPAFNALYERQRALPDGPEREALIDEAKKLMVAYMPYKVHVHRIATDLAHPWVLGYRPQHLRARFLEVHGHRHGRAGAGRSLNRGDERSTKAPGSHSAAMRGGQRGWLLQDWVRSFDCSICLLQQSLRVQDGGRQCGNEIVVRGTGPRPAVRD